MKNLYFPMNLEILHCAQNDRRVLSKIMIDLINKGGSCKSLTKPVLASIPPPHGGRGLGGGEHNPFTTG